MPSRPPASRTKALARAVRSVKPRPLVCIDQSLRFIVLLPLARLDLPQAYHRKGTHHETQRSDREDSRYQAGEGLDVETHHQRDRRYVGSVGGGGFAVPDEAPQAAV